jgi:hypothetical protein
MTNLLRQVPALGEAIAAHARAVVALDQQAAERYVFAAAIDSYSAAMKEPRRLGPLDRYEAPGLARLGEHYISKVRFIGPRGSALMQIRWKPDSDGSWRIAEAEYFPPNHTPWTGVSRSKPVRRENVNA